MDGKWRHFFFLPFFNFSDFFWFWLEGVLERPEQSKERERNPISDLSNFPYRSSNNKTKHASVVAFESANKTWWCCSRSSASCQGQSHQFFYNHLINTSARHHLRSNAVLYPTPVITRRRECSGGGGGDSTDTLPSRCPSCWAGISLRSSVGAVCTVPLRWISLSGSWKCPLLVAAQPATHF